MRPVEDKFADGTIVLPHRKFRAPLLEIRGQLHGIVAHGQRHPSAAARNPFHRDAMALHGPSAAAEDAELRHPFQQQRRGLVRTQSHRIDAQVGVQGKFVA